MKKRPQKLEILGVKIVNARKERVLNKISAQCSVLSTKMSNYRPFWVATAYSETFLEAQDNSEFAQAIEKADWIVLDGVAGWMALDYPNQGLKVVLNALQGKYVDRPVGVEIFRELLEEGKLKFFLLGGFRGVAKRLAQKYNCEFEEQGPDQDRRILNKINKYKPDILFVSYGRFKQEMWIAQNLDKLNCKVVVGVGSAFDEVAKEGVWKMPTPVWIQRMGLKWLWRGLHDAKHWKRIWKAVIIFPWRIYRYDK